MIAGVVMTALYMTRQMIMFLLGRGAMLRRTRTKFAPVMTRRYRACVLRDWFSVVLTHSGRGWKASLDTAPSQSFAVVSADAFPVVPARGSGGGVRGRTLSQSR